MPVATLERPRRKDTDALAQSRSDRARMIQRATGQTPVALLRGGPLDGQKMAVPLGQERIYYARNVPVDPQLRAMRAGTPGWETVNGMYVYAGQQIFNCTAAFTNLSVVSTQTAAAFNAFNYTVTATANTMFNYVWDSNEWSGGIIPTVYPSAQWPVVQYPAPPTITPEEADRRFRETRRIAHRNMLRRQRAVRKGRRLLLDVLSEKQQWEYAKSGAFRVEGGDGNVYLLRKGKTTHQLGVDGKPKLSHCIHLPYSYIDEDTLIGLKLLLETRPEEFSRIANTSPLMVAA